MLRSALALTAAVGFALGVPTVANAQNPTFTDETGTRLVGAGVSTDSSEKDYGIGDFDNDGDDDVVVARRVGLNGNNGSPLPNFLLMNNDGVLTDETAAFASPLSISRRSRDVVVADFNNDGFLDVMVADGPSVAPLLLLNQGILGGGWQGFSDASGMLPVVFNVDAWSIAAGDLTNDGDAYPDVFVGTRNGNDRVLVNLGDSGSGWLGFSDESTRLGSNASTNAVRSVTIYDMNGDGDQDIVEGVTGSGTLRMLKNNGSGQFTSTPQTFASSATYNHGLGDLDNDGMMDIFAVQNGSDQYRQNNGAGTGDNILLGSLTTAPGTNGFGAICRVADIDDNGFDDFLVCDLDQEFPQDCSRRLQFLFNQGSAPFLSNGYGVVPWAPNGTSDVAPIDIDGDLDLDLLIGHCGGNSVFTQDGTGIVLPTFNRGDVNDDGGLDVADAVALLDFLFGTAGALVCDDAGDANDDGGLDIADAVAILDFLFGGTGSTLPAPNACDIDPTDDALECTDYTSCP
ncbi:MAG: VCBS repeat-containing protein [Planctomycetota bacterium]